MINEGRISFTLEPLNEFKVLESDYARHQLLNLGKFRLLLSEFAEGPADLIHHNDLAKLPLGSIDQHEGSLFVEPLGPIFVLSSIDIANLAHFHDASNFLH